MRKMKHGQCLNGKKTSEYRTWQQLRQRCENPNNKAYNNYGGRGIKVCTRWQDFRNFFEDMGKKPGPKYSIDRIDNDGNYEPSNCRWATRHDQRINSRPASCGPARQKWFWCLSKRSECFRCNSQHAIAETFGIPQPSIWKCLHGLRKSTHNWFFAWEE